MACNATRVGSMGTLVCDRPAGHAGSHGNGHTGSTARTGYGPLSWSETDYITPVEPAARLRDNARLRRGRLF